MDDTTQTSSTTTPTGTAPAAPAGTQPAATGTPAKASAPNAATPPSAPAGQAQTQPAAGAGSWLAGAVPPDAAQQNAAALEEFVKGVKPSEGYAGELDMDRIREMAPTLRELGISPEQAGKLASRMAMMEERAIREQSAAQAEQAQECAKLFTPADASAAASALKKYCGGDAGLMRVFTDVLGSNPSVIRLLVAAGGGAAGSAAPGATEQAGMGSGDPADNLAKRLCPEAYKS